MSCSPCSKLLLQNGKLFKDQVMLHLLFKSRFLTMASEHSVSGNHLPPKSSCHLLALLDCSWPLLLISQPASVLSSTAQAYFFSSTCDLLFLLPGPSSPLPPDLTKAAFSPPAYLSLEKLFPTIFFQNPSPLWPQSFSLNHSL